MFFIPNPIQFVVNTKPIAGGGFAILDSSVFLKCAPNIPEVGPNLEFNVALANRTVDFAPVDTELWDLIDTGDPPFGNVKIVKLSLRGERFTEQLRTLALEAPQSHPTRALYDAIGSGGTIGLLIETAGREDVARADNLVVEFKLAAEVGKSIPTERARQHT
jgi:hypothetical protein